MAARDASGPSVTHVAQPEPHAVTALSLPAHEQYSLPTVSSLKAPSKLVKDTAVLNTIAPGALPPASNTSTSAGPANGAVAPAKTDEGGVPAAQIQLAQTQTQCAQGKWTMTIANATMTMQKSAASDSKITWYWESKIDSGSAPSDTPVDTTPATQSVHLGETAVTFAAGDVQQPLLTAPVSSAYSYSIRLHVTDPFDIASEWVSIPVNVNPCSSSTSQ